MNKYAEAVKNGGDYWSIYLDEKTLRANTRSDVFANSALFDKLTMKSCAAGSKMVRANGGGYTDALAGTFSEYRDFCV